MEYGCIDCGPNAPIDDNSHMCKKCQKKYKVPVSAINKPKELGRADLGTLIGQKYILQDILGKGGYGIVFLATTQNYLFQMAIKLLVSKEYISTTMQKMFIKEMIILSELEHPNIVKVFDSQFGKEEYEKWIAMEYVHGNTLRQIIEEEPDRIDSDFIYASVQQILGALSACHEKNIIHRDIKPSNIIVGTYPGHECWLKIVDFGIAKIKAKISEKTSLPNIGSIAYMAPEQHEGKEADNRTDLYALGTILFEMLTGFHPIILYQQHIGGDVNGPFHESCYKAFRTNYEIQELKPKSIFKFPEEFYELVLKILRRDPNQRPSSARDVLDELKRIREKENKDKWATLEKKIDEREKEIENLKNEIDVLKHKQEEEKKKQQDIVENFKTIEKDLIYISQKLNKKEKEIEEIKIREDEKNKQINDLKEKSRWFTADKTRRFGPFDIVELIGLIVSGKFGEDSLAWRFGMAEWKKIKDIDVFHNVFKELKSRKEAQNQKTDDLQKEITELKEQQKILRIKLIGKQDEKDDSLLNVLKEIQSRWGFQNQETKNLLNEIIDLKKQHNKEINSDLIKEFSESSKQLMSRIESIKTELDNVAPSIITYFNEKFKVINIDKLQISSPELKNLKEGKIYSRSHGYFRSFFKNLKIGIISLSIGIFSGLVTYILISTSFNKIEDSSSSLTEQADTLSGKIINEIKENERALIQMEAEEINEKETNSILELKRIRDKEEKDKKIYEEEKKIENHKEGKIKLIREEKDSSKEIGKTDIKPNIIDKKPDIKNYNHPILKSRMIEKNPRNEKAKPGAGEIIKWQRKSMPDGL